jgi:potassium-transporting ATPase KdpC subunit
MKTQIVIALKMLLAMTILTGIVYPLIITGLSQIVFPVRGNGSLVKIDGRVLGSELIGQRFDSIAYFWSRPSAIDYNPMPSGGSNLGPTSEKLKKQIQNNKNIFILKNMIKDTTRLPVEMITASASGIDPHISPGAALMQVDRIVKARKFDISQKQKVIDLVHNKTEKRQFSIFGEEKINVFHLNLELDKIK